MESSILTRYQYRPTDPTTWARFVDEYMKDNSAMGAYMRVYGGSRENAKIKGPKLILRNGYIQQEITKRSEGKITLADVTPERITLELARMALFDPRKTVTTSMSVDRDGAGEMKESPIPLAMLDEDTARAITGISFDVRGNRVLKTDKTAALQTLAKIAGMDRSLTTIEGRAGAVDHDASDEDEITLMLAEFEEADPDDDADIGEEIEGEYADEE